MQLLSRVHKTLFSLLLVARAQALIPRLMTASPAPAPSKRGGVGMMAADSEGSSTASLQSEGSTMPTILRGPAAGRMSHVKASKRLMLFSISDLHADYRQNLDWWTSWCNNLREAHADKFLVVVIAGDITNSATTIRAVLERARDHFDMVMICPGNHDLWISSSMMHLGVFDSVDKLNWLKDTAEELGVYMSGACIECVNGRRLIVLPLMSWYHASWDTEPGLPPDVTAPYFSTRAPFVDRWTDFKLCKWPSSVVAPEDFVSITSESKALAQFFAAMNEDLLKAPELTERSEADTVISFSHFLPRQELCPEKRFLLDPHLPKVIGSEPLCRQVNRLKPDLHIFGHTHIPIDLTLDDVRYVQWPLGSVSEQGRQCADMARKGPVLLFDEGLGGLTERLPTKWGDHYRQIPRDPNKTELAPWVVSFHGRIKNLQR